MNTDALECDDVIYHRNYFVFDPEDVERNHGFFHYVIPNSEGVEVLIEGNMVELVTTNVAAILDPVFWSCLVVMVTLTFLSMTCCCQCCLACFCSKQKYRTHSDWESAKICCGGLTWVLTVLIIACSAVIIWSEFQMNAGVQTQWNSTLLFVNGAISDERFVDAIYQVMDVFYTLQLYRHWISIVMSILTILLMVAAMIATCFCTPYRESATPVTTILIINGIWTVAMSFITAVTFFSLFYMSFLCYDLYRIGGSARCNDESLRPNSLSLQKFCSTDVFVPHLITVSVLLGLLAIMVAWQIVGAFYASIFSRRDPDESHTPPQRRRQEEQEMTPATPTTNVDYGQLQAKRYDEYTQQYPVRHYKYPARGTNSQPSTDQPYVPASFYPPYPNAYQPEYQPRATTASTNVTESAITSPEPAPPQYEDCWGADQSDSQESTDQSESDSV